ncbi:hypothetical protein L9F63_005432, partial [Diploptera punctata]
SKFNLNENYVMQRNDHKMAALPPPARAMRHSPHPTPSTFIVCCSKLTSSFLCNRRLNGSIE